MQASYKLYTSDAKISYKVSSRGSFKKVETTNKTETIVYSISLPISHVYSKGCSCKSKEKISNYVSIKNNNPMVLYDIGVIIGCNMKRITNLEFLKTDKPCKYYINKNFINIKIDSLAPCEELLIEFECCDSCCLYDNPKAFAKLNYKCRVLGVDGNSFVFEKNIMLYR